MVEETIPFNVNETTTSLFVEFPVIISWSKNVPTIFAISNSVAEDALPRNPANCVTTELITTAVAPDVCPVII